MKSSMVFVRGYSCIERIIILKIMVVVKYGNCILFFTNTLPCFRFTCFINQTIYIYNENDKAYNFINQTKYFFNFRYHGNENVIKTVLFVLFGSLMYTALNILVRFVCFVLFFEVFSQHLSTYPLQHWAHAIQVKIKSK